VTRSSDHHDDQRTEQKRDPQRNHGDNSNRQQNGYIALRWNFSHAATIKTVIVKAAATIKPQMYTENCRSSLSKVAGLQ
jgi:hypothetical protein